jgi:Tfp pilus assembly protein PilF
MGYLLGAREAFLGEFKVDGQASVAYAEQFHDRWISFQTGADSLWTSGRPLPFQVQNAFVMAEVETRSAAQLERALGDLGKGLDLKVAGADAQGLVRVLDTLSLRPTRVIEGSIRHAPSELSLTITLLKDGNPERVWTLSRTVPGEKATSERLAAEESLLDEAVAIVALYLVQGDHDPAKDGDKTMPELNAAALADLTRGRRSLERYVNANKQDDLVEAQKYFRSLVKHSPTYTDGYLMLSYALAENRQEREAIEVYDQALDLLTKEAPQQEQRVFEARFLRASSLLRCYRWAETVEAIKAFESLIAELRAKCDKPRPPDNQKEALQTWHENHRMLARTYTETAHCFGHLLVHLPKADPIRTNNHFDDLKALLPSEFDKTPASDTLNDRRAIANRLYAESREYQKNARKVAPIYKREWKAELESRLSEVEGYAQYRHAEWLAPATSDAAFKKECTGAIRSLQSAELGRPQYYALLQNIGMVYLNRRYEARGEDLAIAERYYQRSVELKPGDYYGFEQLARISLRRALLADDAPERAAALKTGNERAAEALKRRPESRGLALVRFNLRLAKIGFDGRKASVDEIDSLVTDLDRRDPAGEDQALRWMRLACEWFRLVASTDEKAFNDGVSALKPELNNFLAAVGPNVDVLWRVAQMRSSIHSLRSQLDTVKFNTRHKVPLDLAAALD